MDSTHVRVLRPEEVASPGNTPEHPPGQQALAGPVRKAIFKTRQWLLARQHPEGYWQGELEGDTILESEYILLLAYLGEEKSPLAQKAARYILRQQLSHGGWALYPGGPIDISGSVKNYFALKLTGHDPAAEYMQRAREAILRHGGADGVNSFTRFYLALLGQISYRQCPSVPPELVLLPKWFPVNIYAMSAWSRTILVPLSIVSALQPVRHVDPDKGIRELFVQSPETWPLTGLAAGRRLFGWDRFFRGIDRLLKFYERRLPALIRRRAIQAAKDWCLAHFEASEGLGAIFPPMVWSVIALKSLGYADDSPQMDYCRKQLAGLVIEDDQTARLEPCKSPVWDTAISIKALVESGLARDDASLDRATQWLLSKEVRVPGDWAQRVRAEPGGWCFEHANQFYPDLDDTAMVAMALRARFGQAGAEPADLLPELRLVGEAKAADLDEARDKVALLDQSLAAIERARRWIEAMQNADGGWGAFDKDNDHEFLCYVPFADHNAMIDPSAPDLTGRVLESLGSLGLRVGDPVVDRAVAYLRRTQEADGSWFGRWGINYIYGTWLALCGLRAVGLDPRDPMFVAGANWLLSFQQASGGWGESPGSYDDPSLRGQGNVTASQTAWALMGLVAAGMARHPAVARGVRFLVSRQRQDGTWDEPEFTGTGFPRVFYLRYHLYRIYFPLMALARWLAAGGAGETWQSSGQMAKAESGCEAAVA
jgi:squalene-hopene/tetraprenyl-beta-curcumene cyclase